MFYTCAEACRCGFKLVFYCIMGEIMLMFIICLNNFNWPITDSSIKKQTSASTKPE